MSTVTASHAGTIITHGKAGHTLTIRCDCGLSFPCRRNPVDPHDSPEWDAHVADAHRARKASQGEARPA
jgi:hypothetical protein